MAFIVWTEDMDRYIEEGRQHDISAAQLARVLDRQHPDLGITKNSVIGRWSRLRGKSINDLPEESDEIRTLRAMFAEAEDDSAIGRAIGRDAASVRRIRARLGLKRPRPVYEGNTVEKWGTFPSLDLAATILRERMLELANRITREAA